MKLQRGPTLWAQTQVIRRTRIRTEVATESFRQMIADAMQATMFRRGSMRAEMMRATLRLSTAGPLTWPPTDPVASTPSRSPA